MLSIGGTTRVFLAVQPVDLRGSFNRLYGYVADVLRENPKSGHWFVFTNRRRSRIKILVFDGTGLWILNNRPDSQCPPNAGCGVDVPLSSVVPARRNGIRPNRTSIRHDCGPIAGRNSSWDSRLDV